MHQTRIELSATYTLPNTDTFIGVFLFFVIHATDLREKKKKKKNMMYEETRDWWKAIKSKYLKGQKGGELFSFREKSRRMF